MTNPLGYHTPTDRYDNDFDRRIAAIELGNAVAYFLGLKPQDEIPFTELTDRIRTLPRLKSCGCAINSDCLVHGCVTSNEVEHVHRPSTFGPGGPIESAITICLDCGKILPSPEQTKEERKKELEEILNHPRTGESTKKRIREVLDEGWDGIK